jgi:hypothetical protein
VATIKKLYNDLELKEMFEAYEEQSYKDIKKKIAGVKGLPQVAALDCDEHFGVSPTNVSRRWQSVFEKLLAKIYKRSK